MRQSYLPQQAKGSAPACDKMRRICFYACCETASSLCRKICRRAGIS